MNQATELAGFVSQRLHALADATKAREMAAYMKTAQPFYGVQNSHRVAMLKEIRASFVPASPAAYRRNTLALWRLPHREEQYLAIGYAKLFPRFVVFESIALYERMIREGAWWDLVDDVAVHLCGAVLRGERARMKPLIEKWSKDDDLWIRRSALLVHLGHKKETDTEQLFAHCLRLCAEKDFFIRKAIGWVLRELSKSDPKAVRGFLKMNSGKLSPLSYREASRSMAAKRALAA